MLHFNNDDYNEQANGSAFDGTSIGRAWPLLIGERAHYEVAAGNLQGAEALMKTMKDFSIHELFSEQIWDIANIPDKELFLGNHSGSAIPLAWAYAEYVKHCASISQKKVVDMPDNTTECYIKNKTESKIDMWCFMLSCPFVHQGNILRLITDAAATASRSADNWTIVEQINSINGGFGSRYIDNAGNKISGNQVGFTLYRKDASHWENINYSVKIS